MQKSSFAESSFFGTRRSSLPRSASLFLIFLFSVGVISPFATAATSASRTAVQTPANNGASVCSPAQSKAFDSIDKNSATSSAQNSEAYYTSQLSAGESAKYYSSFAIEHWTTSTCAVSLIGYNVVFSVTNSSGFVGYLVVSEYPTTLTPTGSEMQIGNPSHGSCNAPCNQIWAGYEPFGSGLILQADSDFNQATPSYPPGGCNLHTTCLMATWVGLEDQVQASDFNLAQDGTDAQCVGSGCTPTYQAWYQMLAYNNGNSAIICTSSTGGKVTIHGGDNIYAATTNEAAYGSGYSASLYDFDIADSTTNTSCYSGGNSYSAMQAPDYGNFIVENPNSCVYAQGCATLPKFGSETFSNAQFYDSSAGYTTLYSAYSHGYYSKDIMQNAPNNNGVCGTYITNVATGSVSSSNTFSTTWQTSQYTPFLLTYC